MAETMTSLFWIMLAAVAAPLLTKLTRRNLIPEVVLLLVFGTIVGPSVTGLAHSDEAVGMLHELGLAMLFLLAGYEIDTEELTGREGRKAGLTWVASLATAFAVVALLDLTEVIDSEVALTIALTSTALGTLLPILKENGLMGTAVGNHVLRHGAYGELGPVVAIALLLGTRGTLESALILAAFAAIAVVLTIPSRRIQRETSALLDAIRSGARTTSQTPVRLTMLLLVTLLAVAAVFQLDIVLGAFAAGFILRVALPDGDNELEFRLEAIAFGLLVPVFFVTSGMSIDPSAVATDLGAFISVVVLILLCRGLPVFVSSRFLGPERSSTRESLAVGLFASTGLPIIVAVTAVAVTADEMSTSNASMLVAAGAATVLICPALATVILKSGSGRVR